MKRFHIEWIRKERIWLIRNNSDNIWGELCTISCLGNYNLFKVFSKYFAYQSLKFYYFNVYTVKSVFYLLVFKESFT